MIVGSRICPPNQFCPLIGRAFLIGLSMLVAVSVGCGSSEPVDHYGSSVERRSVSGFSVFRSLAKQSGFRTYRILGLTQRSKNLDAILWAPTDFGLPAPAAREWIEDWMTHQETEP